MLREKPLWTKQPNIYEWLTGSLQNKSATTKGLGNDNTEMEDDLNLWGCRFHKKKVKRGKRKMKPKNMLAILCIRHKCQYQRWQLQKLESCKYKWTVNCRAFSFILNIRLLWIIINLWLTNYIISDKSHQTFRSTSLRQVKFPLTFSRPAQTLSTCDYFLIVWLKKDVVWHFWVYVFLTNINYPTLF